MTRFRAEIHPEAEAEFKEAYAWYFERSPLAADAFRTEVFTAIDELTDSAGTWPSDGDGFRSRVLTRFPYTLHYDVTAQTVTVIAIAHQRRRPGYWMRR